MECASITDGNASIAATMATIAEAQIYNRYPEAIPAAVSMAIPAAASGYPSGGYGYPGSVYGRGGSGQSGAYGFGYQDGSYMARKDISQNKRFNPNPRNEYGNRTHGYNSAFGDKNYYQLGVQQRILRGLSKPTIAVGRGWGH